MSLLRRIASEQAGFTLVELIIVSAIAPVLLAATLLVFNAFERNAAKTAVAAEAQARTRANVDQLAKELRNLASPTPELPQAIDDASDYDLVFQTVGPSDFVAGGNVANIRRVRWCLNTPTSGDATLYSQVQTWTSATTPTSPDHTACPSTAAGWSAQRVVARGVTNRAQGRPLFLYNAESKTSITAITVQLFTRARTESEPANGLLRSQVFLRNQNQAPLASFTATSIGNGHVLLNGSGSADPDGDDLQYSWSATPCTGTCSWSGVTVDALTGAGAKTISLTVTDGAGLIQTSTQGVTVG
jgi:prepilin-type N-terminal cleavage/methylation domain-containing protein